MAISRMARIVGIVAIGGAVAAFYGCSGNHVEDALLELAQNPSLLEQHAAAVHGLALHHLELHPDLANNYLGKSLELLSAETITSKNYAGMFERVRDKAEQKPEILEYLGPKAREYVFKKNKTDTFGTSFEDIRRYWRALFGD